MIELTTPFITVDPRMAGEQADHLAGIIGGADMPANAVARAPWLGVAVLTEAAGWPDHDRKMWLFDRPETWLPEEIRHRGRGEGAGAYALRVGYALLAMDLMDVGQDGEWHAVRMGVDMSRIEALSDWFDLNKRDETCDKLADDMETRAKGVFEDGYDRVFWLDWAQSMETSIMLGTPVLAAATVVDLSREGRGDEALSLLNALPDVWKDLFDPANLNPDGVKVWVDANRDRATALIQRLVANGLEQSETLKTWEAWK